MARKRTGKLCKHKSTGVYYQNYKQQRLYFTKNKAESRRRWLENVEAIENGEPLPWGPSKEPKRAEPEPLHGLTVRDGLAMAVADREERVGRKEHALRKANELLVQCCGGDKQIAELRPADFTMYRRAMERRFVASTVASRIGNCRSQFHWLAKNDHIDREPKYGSDFERPPRRVLADERHAVKRKYGNRHYSPEEIRDLLDACQTALQRCIVLLGVNAGFGAIDCADLEESNIVDGCWYDGYRGKTSVKRDCYFWDITVAALDDYRKHERPATTSDKVFAGLNKEQIAIRFEPLPLLARCKRKGVGFYGLRHSFETFAAEATDQQATDWIAGHQEHGSGKDYRDAASKARIERVANVVRRIAGL